MSKVANINSSMQIMQDIKLNSWVEHGFERGLKGNESAFEYFEDSRKKKKVISYDYKLFHLF